MPTSYSYLRTFYKKKPTQTIKTKHVLLFIFFCDNIHQSSLLMSVYFYFADELNKRGLILFCLQTLNNSILASRFHKWRNGMKMCLKETFNESTTIILVSSLCDKIDPHLYKKTVRFLRFLGHEM